MAVDMIARMMAMGNGGGTSDAYTKAETDALLVDKADKATTYTKTEIDNMIGGGFTPTEAQLTAMNSGIASTDVAQINTNKNNILLVEQANGKKNLFNLESWKNVPCTRSTLTVSGTEITLTNTTADGYTNYTTADGYPQDCIIPVSAGEKIVATWEIVGTPTDGSVEFLQNGIVTAPYRVYSTYSARYLECTIKDDVTFLTMRLRNFTGDGTSTTVKNLMIYKKSIYDAGFTDYQPYTMSNAELTAAIQAIQAQLANQ